MFSGIIEDKGIVRKIESKGTNLSFWIQSRFTDSLKIDQSIAHNGVCLTVDAIADGQHRVTAIDETLKRTNLGQLKEGSPVNLERCLSLQTLIDGHLVQGHVDTMGECLDIQDQNGSWLFRFRYPSDYRHLIVEKGSITINGVSLTVFNCIDDTFNIAIIPYTFEHTTFGHICVGDKVNLEFDIVGKYIARWMEQRQPSV